MDGIVRLAFMFYNEALFLMHGLSYGHMVLITLQVSIVDFMTELLIFFQFSAAVKNG